MKPRGRLRSGAVFNEGDVVAPKIANVKLLATHPTTQSR